MARTTGKKTAKARERFAEHPAVAYQEAVVRNMQAKTGKSLQQWIALVKKSGVNGQKERTAWLKKEHGLGMTSANIIAGRAEGKKLEYKPDVSVKELFAGKRAGLKPVYDRLMKIGMALGKDVTATPCKTFVPLRRRYVFAQIKPGTNTRIDLGLALKKAGAKLSKRLLPTGGLEKGDRITHRIPLTSVKEIDAEVKQWIKRAYDLDA